VQSSVEISIEIHALIGDVMWLHKPIRFNLTSN